MSVNPSEVASLSLLTPAELESTVTVHGIVSVRSDSITLVEPSEDIGAPRFPIGVELTSMGAVSDGAYVIVSGVLRTRAGELSYTSLFVDVSESMVFEPDAEDVERSQTKTLNIVMEIIRDHGDPIPTRYVIERAGQQDFDRAYVAEIIEKMVDAGALYRPTRGMVFGA